MKNKYFIWIPRGIVIAYILFISMFSLDALSISEFFIHLIPSFALVLVLILTWKKPKLASILFALIGIITIFAFDTYESLFSLLTITLIPIIAGILFIAFGIRSIPKSKGKK